MFIYKITNKHNGLSYIGQTIHTVESRWRSHCYKGSFCRKLSNAIQKHGPDSFEVETIDQAKTLEELNKKEEFWVKELNTLHPHGYNLQTGGKNGIPTEETRQKMSRSQKGIKRPASRKQALKLAAAKKGVKQAPETIAKRAASCRKNIVDCTTGVVYNSIKEAAEALGLQRPNTSMNLKGKNKSCGGRQFQYSQHWDGTLVPQVASGRGKYQCIKAS